MEVLVCQECDQIITYLQADKSGTIYGVCPSCLKQEQETTGEVSEQVA